MAPTLGFTLSFSDFGFLFGTHWRFVASTIFPKTLSLSLCVRFWQFSQYFHLFHYHLCYTHLSADLAEGVTHGRALQCTLSFHQLLENTNETCCTDNEGHLLQESKADHTTCDSQASSMLICDSQIWAWCSSLACMSSPHWPAGAASETGSSRCPSSLTRYSTPRTQWPPVTPTMVTAWPWLLGSGDGKGGWGRLRKTVGWQACPVMQCSFGLISYFSSNLSRQSTFLGCSLLSLCGCWWW